MSINQQPLATQHVHLEAGANFARDQFNQLPQMPTAPLPPSQVLNPLRHQTHPSISTLGQFDFIFHNIHGPPLGAAS